MSSTHTRSLLLFSIAATLALAVPSAASAAPVPGAGFPKPHAKPGRPAQKQPADAPALARASNDELIATAKASPLFRRVVAGGRIAGAGIGRITAADGVEMDVAAYVKSTALSRRPELAPLFDKKRTKGVLAGKPMLLEQVIELEDRLLIDRKLTFVLAEGACAKVEADAELASLCFVAGAAAPSPELGTDVAAMRDALAKENPDAVALSGKTAKELLALSDDALLGIVLNTGERTVHHVSIVPRRPMAAASDRALMRKLDTPLPVAPAPTGLIARPATPSQSSNEAAAPPTWTSQPTEYLLAGFTYGHGFDESWEFTIAKKNFWHDRYYVQLDVHLGLGFGVRAPFAIDVATSGSADTREVSVAVQPVAVDAQGSPVFPAVGLAESKYFEGQEFVLDASAELCVYASIPGPNFSKCKSVGIDLSRDFTPPLGSTEETLSTWWVKGEESGLGIDYSVAGAFIDVGMKATLDNGELDLRVSPRGNAMIGGLESDTIAFVGDGSSNFTVTRPATGEAAGFRLDTPRYAFDATFTPKVRGRLEIDVGVWHKSWNIAEVTLSSLALSQRFELTAHDGTVDHHDYTLFAATGGPKKAQKKAQDLPGAAPQAPAQPKPAKPTKGSKAE